MVSVTLTASAIISIVAGILILVWPRSFRILLGLYLLIVGVLQLIG
ncbi:hypothetical protein CMI42_00065 [Candidatus Pacearchaeota archaeon]|nr:hypothetical protein [Candidatus Pacearchaeota archaeon]